MDAVKFVQYRYMCTKTRKGINTGTHCYSVVLPVVLLKLKNLLNSVSHPFSHTRDWRRDGPVPVLDDDRHNPLLHPPPLTKPKP